MDTERSSYMFSVAWRRYALYRVFSYIHVGRSLGEMYIGLGRLSACLCVCLLSLAAFPHYCTDPDLTWENGRGAL